MRYSQSVPWHPLDVVLVGEDSSLRDSLVRALESDEFIGSVRAVDDSGSTTRQDLSEFDVLPFGAGSSGPNLAVGDASTSLTFVLANDLSEEAAEDAAGTVAYLKKDPGAAGIAPVVVALAALCSPQQD